MNLQCWTQMFLLTHVYSINSTLLWLPRKLQLASLEWTFIDPENFDEGFKELLPKLKAELEDQEKEGSTWKFHVKDSKRCQLHHNQVVFTTQICRFILYCYSGHLFFYWLFFFQDFLFKKQLKSYKISDLFGYSNWYRRR